MKPNSCRVRHDPESGLYGDCLRACVASLLNYSDADLVPHFFNDDCDGETARIRLNEWLNEQKLHSFYMFFDGDLPMSDVMNHMKESNPNIYYLLFGKTTKENDHVVVAVNDRVVHDPAWLKSPIYEAGSTGSWVIMVVVPTTLLNV